MYFLFRNFFIWKVFCIFSSKTISCLYFKLILYFVSKMVFWCILPNSAHSQLSRSADNIYLRHTQNPYCHMPLQTSTFSLSFRIFVYNWLKFVYTISRVNKFYEKYKLFCKTLEIFKFEILLALNNISSKNIYQNFFSLLNWIKILK